MQNEEKLKNIVIEVDNIQKVKNEIDTEKIKKKGEEEYFVEKNKHSTYKIFIYFFISCTFFIFLFFCLMYIFNHILMAIIIYISLGFVVGIFIDITIILRDCKLIPNICNIVIFLEILLIPILMIFLWVYYY